MVKPDDYVIGGEKLRGHYQHNLLVKSVLRANPSTATNDKGFNDNSMLVRHFGCKFCEHRGKPTCPHQIGIKKHERDVHGRDGRLMVRKGDTVQSHSNGICGWRKGEIKELFAFHGYSTKKVFEDLYYIKLENRLKEYEELLNKYREKREREGIDFPDKKEQAIMDKILDTEERMMQLAHMVRKHEEGTTVRHENVVNELRTLTIDKKEMERLESDMKVRQIEEGKTDEK